MTDEQENKAPLVINELKGRIASMGGAISIIEALIEIKEYDKLERPLQILALNYGFICDLLNKYYEQDNPSE